MPPFLNDSVIRTWCRCAASAITVLFAVSCGQGASVEEYVETTETTAVEISAHGDDPFFALEKDYASLAKLTPHYSAAASPPIELPAPRATGSISYRPSCGTDACKVWARFREQRPFPIQTFAVSKVGSGAVLIITEPTRGLAELRTAVADIFGASASTESQRWMIGVDGWVGDLVVTLPAELAPRSFADPLSDEVFRDRLAALAVELWGTSFGLYVEDASKPWTAKASAPQLELNPGELESWVMANEVRWRDPSGLNSQTYAELMGRGDLGTFVSETGELAIFVVEGSAIRAGSLKGRHADFRRFALLTDAILGAVWNDSTGNMALVGRSRQVSPALVPPLRFETLEVLIAQKSDSLAQSYERTLPFAGKLFEGEVTGRDWAPIYLSDDLIDTEYGALLNITDQMLKSWSSAGEIQYVYFNYPLRPKSGQFVFGGRSISDILSEATGGANTSVLFNWNTAGGAAIVSDAGWSSLTATRSAALPVTYGAGLTPGRMEMGELTRQFEEQAYQYYAALGDPNLARVVGYATIYQALRANPWAERGAFDPTAPLTPAGQALKTRADAGIALLAGEVSKTLDEIEARYISDVTIDRLVAEDVAEVRRAAPADDQTTLGDVLAFLREDARDSLDEAVNIAADALAEFKSLHPDYLQNALIASLLVDRGQLTELLGALDRRSASLNAEIDTHNSTYFTSQYAADSAAAAIERKQADLERDGDAIMAMADNLDTLQSELSDLFSVVGDMEAVRLGFIDAHNTPSRGWIRTPSIVLSWSEADEMWVGGHNLDARALRIEESAGISRPEILEQATGPVLRVPPEMGAAARANANKIARMIEHGKVADPTVLASRLAAFKPVAPRPVGQALGIRSAPESGAIQVAAPQATRNASIRDAHLAAREQLASGAEMFVQQTGDGTILLSFQKGGRVECCTQVNDVWQVASYAERTSARGGKIITDGLSEGRNRALVAQLDGAGRQNVVQAAGGGGGRGRGGGSGGPTGGADGIGGGNHPGGPNGSGPNVGRSNPVAIYVGKSKEKVSVQGEDLVAAAREAEFPAKFEQSVTLEASVARELAAEAGLRPAGDSVLQAYGIRLRSTGAGASSEAVALIEIAPGQVKAGEQLAQTAIRAGTGQRTLLDLTAEAKSIIARSPDKSSLRRFMIWVRKSAKAFSLSENEIGQPSHRG